MNCQRQFLFDVTHRSSIPELANPQSVGKSTTVRSCVTFRAHEKAFCPTLMDFGSSSSRFSQILTSPSLPQVTMQLWKDTGFVNIQESASFFKHLVVKTQTRLFVVSRDCYQTISYEQSLQ